MGRPNFLSFEDPSASKEIWFELFPENSWFGPTATTIQKTFTLRGNLVLLTVIDLYCKN